MKNKLITAWLKLKLKLVQAWRWFLNLSPRRRILLVISAVIVVIIFAKAWAFIFSNKTNNEIVRREVEVFSIIDLSLDRGSIPLSGKVSSQSEVTVRAEAGGTIKNLYYRLGDQVSAGTVIAEIENSTQRAGVVQAQSALKSSNIQLGSGENNLTEARHGLINTIKNSYSLVDDAINNHANRFFINPSGNEGASFGLTIINGATIYTFYSPSESLAYELSLERSRLLKSLPTWQKDLATLEGKTDLTSSVNLAKTRLEETQAFLDNIAKAGNTFSASDYSYQSAVNGFKADLAGSRQTIAGAISSLIAANDTYQTKESLYSGTDDSVASASVSQAQAALAMAQSNLAKTIIRSPITGTINSLNLKLGDYVSPTQAVAFISNNQALEVVTYVSEGDQLDLRVGSGALIDNKYSGFISSIAPALDPITKKIEIKIAFKERPVEILNGQSVGISLYREKSVNLATTTSKLMIPLSALKIEPDRLVVFSVASTSRLIAHQITEGPIVGEKIIITGVDPNLLIITDARGLREGDKVIVKTK